MLRQSILVSSLLFLFFKEMTSYRTIDRTMTRPRAHWVGDGFHVYPVFSDLAFTKEVSPLLMFDYAAPKEFKGSSSRRKPRGVGQHPHRGFETVTIAFQGEVEHHDNKGGNDVIYPGDVQWMTAGRGIVHEEYHSKDFTERGGTFEMCQLWVNLPKKYKMVKPRYQPISGSKIPVVELNDGAQVRVIAGKLDKVKGPAKTYSPINLWDVSLPSKGTIVDIPYPIDHKCIIFVRRGSVAIGNQKLGPQEVALLNNTDSDVDYGKPTCSTTTKTTSGILRIHVLKNDSAVVVMGGEPIDEPIANMGPFVMNTNLELQEAARDYQSGRF